MSEIIKLHDLRPAKGANKPKHRVGRGEAGKGGKTAGRGTKGTSARKQVSAAFEGGQMPLHMRLPKLRGFKNSFKVTYQVVNVDQIATHFPQGGEVNSATLVEAGLGRWTPDDVKVALEAKDRTACGPVAPSDGLYLTGVDYGS